MPSALEIYFAELDAVLPPDHEDAVALKHIIAGAIAATISPIISRIAEGLLDGSESAAEETIVDVDSLLEETVDLVEAFSPSPEGIEPTPGSA